MRKLFFLLSLCSAFLFSCTQKHTEQSAIAGTIKILVDESFEPIIEDQYLVFESSYPQAKIDLIYKPETSLINLILQERSNVAILSRKLLPNEAKIYESKGIVIKTNRIATDAIALVVHKSSADTTITIDKIKALMRGEAKGKTLVFDNQNSSTVRYLKELAQVNSLPKTGLYALNTNPDVIKYVHNNPGTIGVIGFNWIKQPTKELEPLVANLKTMSVKNSAGLAGSDKFYKPNQNNLALDLYPLSRELYIINCEGGFGLGTSFAAFLAGERGQRIMLKSGLLPDSIPSRQIIIRKNIKKN